MTTLNLLKVSFDMPIQHSELLAFKKAFQAGFTTQTQPQDSKKPAYPMLQFKTRYETGKLQPMVMVLGDKIGAVREILTRERLEVRFRDRQEQLKVYHSKWLPFELSTKEELQEYQLFKYHAFNQENYQIYQRLKDEVERQEFIRCLLEKHFGAFVKGIGWKPDPPIQIQDLQIKRQQLRPYRSYQAHCFDLSFRTNLWVPEHIGLGKGVSLGFGVLRLPKKK